VDAVRSAFCDEARLEADTPGVIFSVFRSALRSLRSLGYPFEVSQIASEETALQGLDRTGHASRASLLESIRELATVAAPGSEVLPVGSFAWDIDTEGSDLDVVINLPSSQGGIENEHESLDLVLAALKRLQKEGRAPQGLEAAEIDIYGAGTGMPVLAIRVPQDGAEPLSVDMCTVGNMGSVRDALLFRHMFLLMPQLQIVLQLLKRWLRLRAIPTSSEGGYPQVFWMRLAARTFQMSSSSTRSLPPSPQDADASESRGDDADAREQLRGFCAQWSQSLPTWGAMLNLVGEEPCPYLKRLPAGVYGAGALICLRELDILGRTTCPEELPRADPRQHLCPANAGFWAAFLIPGGDVGFSSASSSSSSPSGSPRSSAPASLVAGWVRECVGQREQMRCGYYVDAGRDGCPEGSVAHCHEFISRRDSDWVMLVDVVSKDESSCLDCSTARKNMALYPQHFVCILDGNPSTSVSAEKTIGRLQELLSSPVIAANLPAPYPLHRYSRRVLLNTLPPMTPKSTNAQTSLPISAGKPVSDARTSTSTASNSKKGKWVPVVRSSKA